LCPSDVAGCHSGDGKSREQIEPRRRRADLEKVVEDGDHVAEVHLAVRVEVADRGRSRRASPRAYEERQGEEEAAAALFHGFEEAARNLAGAVLRRLMDSARSSGSRGRPRNLLDPDRARRPRRRAREVRERSRRGRGSSEARWDP
jgi:hypothetical protein